MVFVKSKVLLAAVVAAMTTAQSTVLPSVSGALLHTNWAEVLQ